MIQKWNGMILIWFSYDMIWYNMTWYETIWHDMNWHDPDISLVMPTKWLLSSLVTIGYQKNNNAKDKNGKDLIAIAMMIVILQIRVPWNGGYQNVWFIMDNPNLQNGWFGFGGYTPWIRHAPCTIHKKVHWFSSETLGKGNEQHLITQ